MTAPASRSNPCLAGIDVFVLAGGLGTRIRSVLGDVPKLLAPLVGRTYLSHLLDWLRKFGARRVVLGLGFQAQAVISHLRQRPFDDLDIEALIEPEPLGTAGALRFARAMLRTPIVLVLNGDSLVDADLCEFIRHHRASGAVGTLLCASVNDARRYGRVVLEDRGRIAGFAEKDAIVLGPALISAGIYLLSAGLLDDIVAGGATSLERDVFARLPSGSLAAFTKCDKFIDIGTPESLAVAGTMFNTGR